MKKIKVLTHMGVGGERGRVYSINGLAPCTSATTHKDPTKILEEKEMGYRIRKLTPRECFRLQGFSDIDYDRAEQVVSNTQLYRQAGNSICVPVIEHLLKELEDYIY